MQPSPFDVSFAVISLSLLFGFLIIEVIIDPVLGLGPVTFVAPEAPGVPVAEFDLLPPLACPGDLVGCEPHEGEESDPHHC